ncbi:hypothetical protein Sjap_002043 [Stephania japonica]|uniref:Protein kinase domain-containing protein n=1 Tax=Stephania japonica TaxID=461633 RepID=A0AAP0KMP9_9MAGN
MSADVQRVVVIQDASREVSSSAIAWALHGLSLKPGDELTLLAVLHQIQFSIKVVAGSSPKIIALHAAIRLRATWVILDRKSERAKNTETKKTASDGSRSTNVSYDEMLPGIPDEEDLFSLELFPIKSSSKNKHSLVSESLGTSKAISEAGQAAHSGEGRQWHNSCKVTSLLKPSLSNDSMPNTVPSSQNETASSNPHKKSGSPTDFQEEENIIHSLRGTSELCSIYVSLSQEISQTTCSKAGDQEEEHRQSFTEGLTNERAEWQIEEAFEDSICSVCNNRRPKIGTKKDFTHAELQNATDGFSSRNFLSEGGFGFVYKGKLRDGTTIAVKQHKDASLQGEKEFKSEVYVLSKARHTNVVMLLGSCSEGSYRLLVYEYVCNGSLDQLLSSKNYHIMAYFIFHALSFASAKQVFKARAQDTLGCLISSQRSHKQLIYCIRKPICA